MARITRDLGRLAVDRQCAARRCRAELVARAVWSALVLVLAGLSGLAVWLASSPAHGRWRPAYGTASPEVQTWFKNQHNQQGQWCCDESDGHPFFGDYKINDDGSVTIHYEGRVHQLPAHMVLKGPNPTGHAVWWFTGSGATHRDYCFAPGTLT